MIEEKVRCFICLELDRKAIHYIEELQRQIQSKGLFYGKVTESENLHLTLKFLGEIEAEKVEEVKKRLKEIKFKDFNVGIGEIGVFSEKMLKILWIKLNGKGIWDLQKEVDNKLKDLFEKEERFMSHITIARIKNVLDKKIFLDYIKKIKPEKINFKIKEFVLKRSELKPEEPDYEDIERYNCS